MTDERTISRRDSLRGIAASGALIGGAGIGLGTVSAGEEPANGDELGPIAQVDFEACHSVFFLLEDAEALPMNVWIQTYNAERDRIENVVKPITTAHLYQYSAKYGDYYVAEFNVLQFYDHAADAGDEIVSVTIDGETIANPNDCSSFGGDGGEDGANDGKKKKHEKDEKNHEKHKQDEYEQKLHEKGKTDGDDTDDGDKDEDDDNGDEPVDIDPDAIELVPECVDTTYGLARYRIENENDATVAVDYDVHMSDQAGTIGVAANSATYFEVGATTSEGMATVQLWYNDALVDEQASNTDEECIPRDRLHLFVDSVDPEADEATFYIMNYEDGPRTAVVRIGGTDVAELATVPANGSRYFTLTVPDGEATVHLFYEGARIDYETSGA